MQTVRCTTFVVLFIVSLSFAVDPCWEMHNKGYYETGSEVSYQNKNYRAKWGTSETPTIENWGGWKDCGECEMEQNTPPYDITLSKNTIMNGTTHGSQVGILNASDNEGGSLMFSLAGSDLDNSKFHIKGSILYIDEDVNIALKDSYSIKVKVKDAGGLSHKQTLVLNVIKNTPLDTKYNFVFPILSDHAVYATEDIHIYQSAGIEGGHIGAGGNFYTQGDVAGSYDITLNGNVYVAGNLTSQSHSNFNGSIVAGGSISVGSSEVIGDTISHFDKPVHISIPLRTMIEGSQNITAGVNSVVELAPGSYKKLSAFNSSKVILQPGTYYFDSLNVSGHLVEFICDIEPDETIDIVVNNHAALAQQFKLLFAKSTLPYNVRFHTNQLSSFIIGPNVVLNGVFTAPRTEVILQQSTVLTGALYAKQVNLKEHAHVRKPASLKDIIHSEWAYSPPFQSTTLFYNGIVTDDAVAVTPSFVANSEYEVFINDFEVGGSVNLESNPTRIKYKVINSIKQDTTYYFLDITQRSNHPVFCNSSIDIADSVQDGNSWSTAFKSLSDALDLANAEGREVWIAEGRYVPTKFISFDGINYGKTFFVRQGVEIIGAFKGDEQFRDPKGSPYHTILSGDVKGNDTSGTQDSLFYDNSLHVVTVHTTEGAKSVRIKGVTISDGRAINESGAGIYSNGAALTLEECVIKNNTADIDGGGLYATNAPSKMYQVLFKNNVAKRGQGGGLYIAKGDTLRAESIVFDGNNAKDTINGCGGGMVIDDVKMVSFTNSIAYGNNAGNTGGFAYVNRGLLELVHFTMTKNTAKVAHGIIEINGAIKAYNSILWNPFELCGDNLVVDHCCVIQRHEGVGNFSTNPMFVNDASAIGDDGKYGTNDDGLMLQKESPCINVANESINCKIDIKITNRPSGNGYDLGCYEYQDYKNDGTILLGRIINGEFKEINELKRIDDIYNRNFLRILGRSKFGYVLQIKVDKGKYTHDDDYMYTTMHVRDINNQPIIGAESIRIDLKRVGTEGNKYIYHSQNGDWGKTILFIANNFTYHNYENKYTHPVYLPNDATFNFFVKARQFVK